MSNDVVAIDSQNLLISKFKQKKKNISDRIFKNIFNYILFFSWMRVSCELWKQK